VEQVSNLLVSLFSFMSYLEAAVGCRTDIEVSDWQVENLLHGR
jgi:hypothetical protein